MENFGCGTAGGKEPATDKATKRLERAGFWRKEVQTGRTIWGEASFKGN